MDEYNFSEVIIKKVLHKDILDERILNNIKWDNNLNGFILYFIIDYIIYLCT